MLSQRKLSKIWLMPKLVSDREIFMKTKVGNIIETLEISDERKAGISQLESDMAYGDADLTWKTDCFLISWCSKELTAAGLLDHAVLAALGSDIQLRMPFLEQMLSHSDEYNSFLQKASPYMIFVGDMISYGVLEDFARKFGAAFERAGYRVIYQDIHEIQRDYVQKFYGKSYRGIIMMPNTLISEKIGDKYLLDYVNAPVYMFAFDHPEFFYDALRNSPDKIQILTPDLYYAEYVERYLHRKALFFPPGGERTEEIYRDFDEFKAEKLQENTIDFSFLGEAGQGIDEVVSWFHENKKELYPFASCYADHLMDEREKPCDAAFRHALEEMSQIETPLSDDDFAALFSKWVGFEKNISHTFKKKIVQQIVTSGLNIDLYGNCWEKITASYIDTDGKNRIHISVPHDEAKNIYRRSWMSLNIMAWHKAGFTERIVEPQLHGSLVVADTTEYLKENYTDGEDIVLFDISDEGIRELPDRLKALLSDRDRILHMAWNGYQDALKHHTWDARVEQFLEKTVGISGNRKADTL